MYRYIADLHIGCTNSFEHRTLEHDEILVKNWNSVVNNNDTTFILGDIGRCGNNKDNEYLCSVISRLKSKKILVVGNHDESGLKDYRVKQLFETVVDYFELTDNYNGINQKLVLSHYPIAHWYNQYRGAVHLYGHVHNTKDYQAFLQYAQICKNLAIPFESYNVGCMLYYMDYTPRTLDEIRRSAK